MSASLESLLEHDEANLWHRYRSQAERGLRKQALDTLEAFTSALVKYPLDQSDAWAAEFCTLFLDERQDLPLQHPLLVRVLLPALRRGYERGRYPYARWLAQLNHEINRSGEAAAQALGFSVLHPERLLEEALEMSPDDMIAVSESVALMVKRFRFYTHEVPICVLVDSKAFGGELDRFERLTQRYGMYARYAAAIKYWRSHCQAWASFLSHRVESESYVEYLARNYPNHLEWGQF